MKRALLTGGAGFIGAHIVARLLQAGWRVRVLDDSSTGSRNRLPGDSAQFEYIEGSVLDRDMLAKAAAEIDLVVHLAAVVGMQQACRDPAYAFRVSREGTENVLSATRQSPAVLFSSSSVYGIGHRTVASENDPICWDDCLAYDGGVPGYATGKFALEKLGRNALDTGRPILILRPFNVVGPGQVGDYGMVLPRFVERALRGDPITIYGDGLQSRSFSEVGQFVECIYRLIHTEQAWLPAFNPINIGARHVTRIRDLAEMILQQTRTNSEVTYLPYATAYPGKIDVRHRYPDVKRLEHLIGPVAWPSLREIVSKFIDGRHAFAMDGAAFPVESTLSA